MITLNGRKFARNNREFTESLFFPGGTCVGYYKPLKRVIYLLDMQGNRIGAINQHKALMCANRQEDGSYWYNLADIPLIGEWASYSQQCDEIADIVYKLIPLHPPLEEATQC